MENQALHFAQELGYRREKVQMCTESSDLQFRDILFLVKKVFFFVLCTCMFPVLAASVHYTLQGWQAAPCESSCDHQNSSGSLSQTHMSMCVQGGFFFI